MAITKTTATQRRSGYLRVPHLLLTGAEYRGLSTDAKLLYCLLQERQRLSEKHGWVDEDGRTYLYFSVEETAEYFDCGVQKARDQFRQLTSAGLIERHAKQGTRCCRIYVRPLPGDSSICNIYDPISPGGKSVDPSFPQRKRDASPGGKPRSHTIYRERNNLETTEWKKRAIERMMAWKDEEEET